MEATSMKISNVLNCSFSSWYEQFRKVTIKSRVIPLPKDFIDYLLADGIVLPVGSYVEPKYDTNSDNDDDRNCDNDEVDWSCDDVDEPKAPSFPALEDRIKYHIDELGGSVFPKLNWSSPKDAKWISANHTLQCSSIGEVFLLLKSSDFITHDLTQPYKDCSDWKENKGEVCYNVSFELVLRKWVDVNPGAEFRCFVRNDSLIAICQRDTCNFYDYVVSRKTQIVRDIVSFFKENIRGKFPDKNYVFDIHQLTKDYIQVIDFNPFGVTTDGLLFDWDDLTKRTTGPDRSPEFRCITSFSGIQPNPYQYYAMPVDFLDISTGQDSYKMIDLLQLMNGKPEKTPYSSESEDEEESISPSPS